MPLVELSESEMARRTLLPRERYARGEEKHPRREKAPYESIPETYSARLLSFFSPDLQKIFGRPFGDGLFRPSLTAPNCP